MQIKCRSFSCHAETHGHGVTQTILANEPRVDLLLDEIISEKGIDFVLNAIGEEAILNYINKAIAA